MPALTTVEADIKKVWTFGKSHLILTLALVAALVGGMYLFESKRADVADAKAAASQALAQQQDAENAKIQAANAAQIAQLIQVETQLATQLQTLQTQYAALAAQRQQSATVVAQLPAAAVQGDLETKLGGPLSDPDVLRKDDAIVTDYPLVEDQLKVETISVSNLDDQVVTLKTEFTTEQASHASDNATCKVDKQTLNDTIGKVKADARKSKFKWFLGGYIAGFISGKILKL